MKRSLLYLIDKFAKLTDNQYKQIYHSQYMKDILNSKDLIDEFNISLPQYSEKEIAQHYNISKGKSNIETGWKILSDKKIDEFISTEGGNRIPNELSKSLYRYVENQEKIELQDDDILALRRYFIGNVRNLIEDYAFSASPDINIIYSFIDAYTEIKSANKGPTYSAAVMTLIKDFYIMCMNRKLEETDKYLVKKYEDALKVRESDMFDFLFEQDKEFGMKPTQNKSSLPRQHQEAKKKEEEALPVSKNKEDELTRT